MLWVSEGVKLELGCDEIATRGTSNISVWHKAAVASPKDRSMVRVVPVMIVAECQSLKVKLFHNC